MKNLKILLTTISIIVMLNGCASTKQIEYVYKPVEISYTKMKPSKIHLPDFKYTVLTEQELDKIKYDVENSNNHYILFEYEEYKKAARRETILKETIKELIEINKYYGDILDDRTRINNSTTE